MPILLDNFSKSLLKKPSDIVLDDVGKSILDKADPTETSPIDQMKVAADDFAKKNVQGQFDQMAQETLKLPPEQRNATANSQLLTTLTGGMNIPEAQRNATAQVDRYKAIPKEISDIAKTLTAGGAFNPTQPQAKPMELLDAASKAAGVASTPFVPAAGGIEGILKGLMTGQNPATTAVRGMVDPASAPLVSSPETVPLMPFERQGGVAPLIPRAILQGIEQMALGSIMGAPEGIGKAVESAKVKGAAKDFEAEFAKIDPKQVQDSLEKQGLFKPEMSDAEKADVTTAVMSHLKENLKANPAVGDYFAKQQTLPKLAGDLEMSLREGIKTDVPLKPGERGSTGVPEDQQPEPKKPEQSKEILPPQVLDIAAPLKAAIIGQQPSVQPIPTGQIPQPDTTKYKANLKSFRGGNVNSAHIGDIPQEIAQAKNIPSEVHIDWKAVNKIKEKHKVSVDDNFVDNLNSADSIVFSKSDPAVINFIKRTPNGEDFIIATRRFNGHFVVTGFEAARPEYAENIKKRGEVINLAGRPLGSSIETPKGASQQELSGVSKITSPSAENIPLPDHIVKSLPEIEPTNPMLEGILPTSKVQSTVKGSTGITRAKTPIKATEEALLKRELGQEQKAAASGYRVGRKEAIAQLKNEYSNKSQALRREARMQRLKDDIVARDKESAKIGTLKAKMEAKLDNQERQAELQRLQDDIKNRDISKGDERARKTVIDYIKGNLPVEDRGKFLSAAANSKTYGEIVRTFRQVDAHVTNIERSDIIEKLKSDSAKAMESGKVAVEYKKMINDIMGGIELKKRRPETLDRLRRTREFVEKQRAAGKDVDMPDRILNQLEIFHRKSADQLSIGELNSIHANIQDFVKLGETKLKSRQAIYDMEKERITNDLLAGTMPLEKNSLVVAEVGEKLTPMQKFQNIFHKVNQTLQHLDLVITPMDTFFDLLDGGHASFDGPNYRHFKVGMDTDYQTYLRNHNNDAESAIRLAHELKLDDQNFERIGVYAMTMQENGRQKLLDRGMTDKQIDAITLTPDEMKWYKLGRKLLEEVRPAIEETMKNVWNKPLGHVKNYWPMMTDYEKLTDAEIFERFGEGVPEVIHPTKKTPQGFTKERVGGNQPVKINAMDVLLKHLDDAHYLVNMSRRIKMLSEVSNSPDIKKASGDLGSVLTKEWLDLMARKGGIAGQQRIAILDILRRNFGLAQLGLNVGSALIQPTALLDGAAILGNYAFDGTYQIITNKAAREFVFNNMPELKARVGEDPAFVDFGDNKFMTKMGEVGYAPLKFLDSITANGIAWGAYLKKMKELGEPVDLTKPNKVAIEYAQSIVRQTQSSGLYKDAAPGISRGRLTGNKSFDKAIFQFQSFVLTRWNVIRNRLWRANIMGGRDSSPGKKDFRKAAMIISMLALAWALESEIRRGVRGATDKLTGNVAKEKTTLSDDVLQNMLTTIPFIGQMISMAVYKSDPIPSFSGVRKIAEGTGSLFKTGDNFIHGRKITDKSKTVVDTLAGLGSAFGVPGTAQASKLTKSNLDSDTKGSAVNLYEQAMRTSDQKEREKLWSRADQLSVENRILKEDAQNTAEKRIRKEIEDAYEQAILKKDDKALLEKADNIGRVAKFTEDELDDMYSVAEKRIDKRVEKSQAIEDQSRTYKPRPGIFDEAKKLMNSFRE